MTRKYNKNTMETEILVKKGQCIYTELTDDDGNELRLIRTEQLDNGNYMAYYDTILILKTR